MSDTQATFLATLIDEWARCGVLHAVVAPGNRSTLMSALLLRDGRIKVHVMVDERSAAFFALGLAKGSGVPTVLWCTSGTAPAELHAAVIEANQGHVPLLVCTADRPPELHHARDWQTVDQSRLYDGAVRWNFSPGVADGAMTNTWRSIAVRAFEETISHPLGAGPVHLNLAIREPWTPDVGDLPPARPDGAPFHQVRQGRAGVDGSTIADFMAVASRRGVIVMGEGFITHGAALRLSEVLGWPVLADSRSSIRRGHPNVIGAVDDILRSDDWRDRHVPEVALRFGAPPISKQVASWLQESGAEQWLLDPLGEWVGPAPQATRILRCQPMDFCEQAAACFDGEADQQWLADWQAAETAAQAALDEVLGTLSEPAVCRTLTRELPDGANLFAATSMPVRDVEWYGMPRDGLSVRANRGASGMDGVVSTAAGVAAATKDPTVLVIGDLTFLYDLNALWVLKGAAEPVNLTIVVLDNNGGGIFSMLPQLSAMSPEEFERVVGTPHGVDIPAVAASLGVHVTPVTALEELMPAVDAGLSVGGLRLVYVRTDRQENVEVHRRIHEAVVSALP